MPVSNTPMRTPAPRNPAAHSFSAPNSAVTLLRAACSRRAAPPASVLSLPLPYGPPSLSRPIVGRVHSLGTVARGYVAPRKQFRHYR